MICVVSANSFTGISIPSTTTGPSLPSAPMPDTGGGPAGPPRPCAVAAPVSARVNVIAADSEYLSELRMEILGTGYGRPDQQNTALPGGAHGSLSRPPGG